MNDLIPITNPNPQALFAPGGLGAIVSQIEADARALVADATTAKGRDAIASNAARVARSKTYLDGLGKEYVTLLKELPKQVDAERKVMRDRLDALKEEVRKPLTDWEEARDRRIAALRARIAAITAAACDLAGLDATALTERITNVQAIIIDDSWGEFAPEAAMAKDAAMTALHKAFHIAEAKEIERAEAAIRQAEEAAQAQAERETRIAAEAAAEARRQAEFEAQRQALEAERSRIAAVQAQQEAERRANDAERRAAIALQESADRERQAIEQERARLEALAAAERHKADLRAQDDLHRAEVHAAIYNALSSYGICSKTAAEIVADMDSGLIPHVYIKY